ncbi:MAG: hypothetical protein M3Y28_00745 [Armatimonadota bacterium]|nr:hypothetical protein [Armatimonadota bacterium]
MKTLRVIVPIFALLLVCAAAWAKPPTLTPSVTNEVPTEINAGTAEPFTMVYQQAQGDPPKDLFMVVQTPEGATVRVAPPTTPSGDPQTDGINVTWIYKPLDSGTYRYHFEATSTTGSSVRFPATEDLQFVSVSLVSRYIIFGVGLLIALFFLPFVVYVATRSLNRRSDPAAAARVALLIGVLASFGLYLYLFWSVYGGLGIALAAIASLGILIALFSRRRAT